MTKKFTHQLLVSTPTSQKYGFYKTVVLIIKDKKRATFGLCINRQLPAFKCECGLCLSTPLFIGGPEGMDRRYFFMHDQEQLAEPQDKIFDKVFLSCPHVSEDFEQGKGRMITGFCRWEPGELRKEIAAGWWLVEESPDPSMILNDTPQRLWRDLSPRHASLMFGSEN